LGTDFLINGNQLKLTVSTIYENTICKMLWGVLDS